MPGKAQRPNHINAVLPLVDLQAHAAQIKNDATKRPLTDSQRQTFLSLSVAALKAMNFTASDIIALFPSEPVRTNTPPAPPSVPTFDIAPTTVKTVVPTGPDKTVAGGLFGRNK